MPLLSFEGVEVDIPTSLTGIKFAFVAGSLTIQCRGFTGDIVLSKPAVKLAATTGRASIGSKKRTIDLSASDDDDDEAESKRLRPNFLQDVDEPMTVTQTEATQQTEPSALPIKSTTQLKTKGKAKATTEPRAEGLAAFMSVASTTQQEEGKTPLSSAKKSKTPTKKSKTSGKKGKKATSKDVEADGTLLSPDPSKAPTSRKAASESHKKRGRPAKGSSTKSMKQMMLGPSKPTRIVTAKWESVDVQGNLPPERWGHTATKISNERVVVYGGADDDERTLGDLHVFDLATRRWSSPMNCESLPRTWHDAVFLASKNLLLAFGGERAIGDEGDLDILSDIMVLDTECFLWYPPAIRGAPPTARSGHTCTVVGNDVVVFGGSGGRNRQSSVHVLDSDDWNWKAVKVEGKPPSARTYHSAVTVGLDRIVYFGGNDSTKSFDSVHVLQKAEKKSGDAVWAWTHPAVTGQAPQARTGHSATLLKDGKILIFGGWDPQRDGVSASPNVFNDAFLLDTNSWEWQSVTFTDEEGQEASQRGRVGHRAVCGAEGRVHLFGGQNSVEQRLQSVSSITISEEELEKEPKQEPKQELKLEPKEEPKQQRRAEPEREAPSGPNGTSLKSSLEAESV